MSARCAAEDRLGRALHAVLALASVAALGTLGWTIALRVGSPYPLEWMEGASLQHAVRLLEGRPLYAAPTAEFIPYLYPPLAYLPFAGSAALLGATLPAARAVSVACLLGSLWLLGRAGGRAAGARGAGLVAAGTFAAGFGYGGAFLDLVRVDACFVLLLCAALERVVAGRLAAALGLLALSALAKQHGLLLLALVSGACLWEAPRLHARAVLAAWLGLLAAATALQLASGGAFARYVLEVPAGHGLEPRLLLSFVFVDLALYLPALVLGAWLAVARGAPSPALLALLLGAIAVSALGRAHPGGDDNVRLPALALLAVVGSAALCARAFDARRPRRTRLACAAALLVQLAVLYQPPSAHAPSASTQQRYRMLEAALVRCAHGGTRTALDFALAGDAPFAHTMALSDLRLAGDGPLARDATRRVLTAIARGRAPDALALGERFPALDAALADAYAPCATLPSPEPPTGYAPGDRRAPGAPRQIVYTRAPTARRAARPPLTSSSD